MHCLALLYGRRSYIMSRCRVLPLVGRRSVWVFQVLLWDRERADACHHVSAVVCRLVACCGARALALSALHLC